MGKLLGGGSTKAPAVVAPPPLPIPIPAVPLPAPNAKDTATQQQAIVRRRQSANTILTDSEDALGE